MKKISFGPSDWPVPHRSESTAEAWPVPGLNWTGVTTAARPQAWRGLMTNEEKLREEEQPEGRARIKYSLGC
jgi:hypothetical protein